MLAAARVPGGPEVVGPLHDEPARGGWQAQLGGQRQGSGLLGPLPVPLYADRTGWVQYVRHRHLLAALSPGALMRMKRPVGSFVVEGDELATVWPSSADVELDLEPGEYRYYCDVVGHEDMEGTLVVQ